MKIDLRDTRPLTANQIARILCGILEGVAAVAPAAIADFADAMAGAKFIVVADKVTQAAARDAALGTSWMAAFHATIIGLLKWCAQKDVVAAVMGVGEHLPVLFPVPRTN